jgi:hypothetical protein
MKEMLLLLEEAAQEKQHQQCYVYMQYKVFIKIVASNKIINSTKKNQE